MFGVHISAELLAQYDSRKVSVRLVRIFALLIILASIIIPPNAARPKGTQDWFSAQHAVAVDIANEKETRIYESL